MSGRNTGRDGGATRAALERAALLLRAAEDLGACVTLLDVRRTVRALVVEDFEPAYVGLVLAEQGRLRRVTDPDHPVAVESAYAVYGPGDAWPSARAARDGAIVTVADRDELRAHYAPEALAMYDELELASAVCVPLPGTRGVVGVLVLGWDAPYAVDLADRAVLTTIAGYTAQAVERARLVDDRVSVARELQAAMLTDLPLLPRIGLAGLYRASSSGDLVGGDWYDAYALPAPAPEGTIALTVGDITGHDMRAAAIMGQVRAMLRQADFDHPERGPAAAVAALENACESLELDATGTLVHAHLHRDGREWELRWTNAGHPPPLLALRDGTVHKVLGHDRLLWPGLVDTPRTEHRLPLPPGSTLLLYTDGFIERRGHDIEDHLTTVATRLADHADLPLPALVDVLATHAADTTDDLVLLTVRVPARI
ncbi:PP2C family protein-serine/threonine phosphatase [Actinomadura flavalba]|uniref:PP2C family protein-serine/threonine phosphatase n=1 Tax=Actinomadura flavalba TaxID=1120938 RepID=UPI00037A4999|nr:SpoIIE family protein phosphatase [Actinomadura flavalba]